MTTVVLEHDAGKLEHLTEQAAVRDASGRLLGYFQPSGDEISLYEGVEDPVGNEELRRRQQDKAGLTTAEVRAFLKRLEQS